VFLIPDARTRTVRVAVTAHLCTRWFARLTRAARLGAGVIGLIGLVACGSDGAGPNSNVVGGRCNSDNDCSKRCLTGSQVPGGYCTVTCATDHDCPSGAICAKLNGDGVCLATCKVPADCNGFGPGYQCNRQPRQQGGDGALACLGG